MRYPERRHERGVALLEVMIAIAVLASAGASLIALLSQALRDEQGFREREQTLRAAERVLTAAVLLTQADLDRRLGRRQVGAFAVEVQRPQPTLYRLAVSELRSPAVEILATVVYRPERGTP